MHIDTFLRNNHLVNIKTMQDFFFYNSTQYEGEKDLFLHLKEGKYGYI